jgi:hypothetical protein
MHRQFMENSDLPAVGQQEKRVSAIGEVSKFLAICLAGFGVVAALTFLAIVLFLSFAAP